MRALLLAGGVTAAPALALVAPSPSGQAPQFPSTVEQVLVDAVVLDCDGAPVGGLTRDDFVLKEDRAAQSIVSFEAVDVAPGPARDALEPQPSVTANPAAGGRTPGRTFLVVFDDTRLSAGQGEAAKRALRDFLRTRVGDADNLLLVTTGGSTWWGARLADGRDDVEALIESPPASSAASSSARSTSARSRSARRRVGRSPASTSRSASSAGTAPPPSTRSAWT